MSFSEPPSSKHMIVHSCSLRKMCRRKSRPVEENRRDSGTAPSHNKAASKTRPRNEEKETGRKTGTTGREMDLSLFHKY
ncbi:hypothetical protein GWI33_000570 [Rhynchophorus ferrugineus]|uniref:Uncharacterized protein n=1 Tax=Rhynchophorus ferrugineus TaxID=354439 RepID=A0A834IMR3_RHYFE|nr:hypothetical protein GWI33_000570 [Rhynchophorus ferrugineus]